MTKKVCAVLLILIATTCTTAAQDPPLHVFASGAEHRSAGRAQRSHQFMPPPMEGTISLGIFDSNKKLVRSCIAKRRSTNSQSTETR